VYPGKGIWWIITKIYARSKKGIENIQEKQEKSHKNKSRPRAHASYSSLKKIKTIRGNISSFEKYIYNHESLIGLIIGARGSGKSGIGMRLVENYKAKTDKSIYAMGFKEETLPTWMNVIKDVNTIENNSVILVDEGGIEFSSRKSMSKANTILSELLMIARHKDLTILFITQNSSNLEVNVLRQADFLLLKKSSLMQQDFERKKIQKLYQKVEKYFDEFRDEKGLVYIYSDEYTGFASNTLPSFWSNKVSKGYA